MVVQSLPEEQMKFALNAALDVLPHNNNLQRGKKRHLLGLEDYADVYVGQQAKQYLQNYERDKPWCSEQFLIQKKGVMGLNRGFQE